MTSAESKATYAQIKEYVWNKFELKVLTLYIAQIKKKCGIKLREHYNKSKKRSKFCVTLLIKNYKQRDFVMDTLLVPILFAAPLFYSFDNALFILKCISRMNPLTYQVENADKIPDFDAMFAGVSIYTMNKLTSDGNVTMEVIEKICTALNCKVDDILEFIKE